MSVDKTVGGLAAIGVVLLLAGAAAPAEDVLAWSKDRDMRYAAFKLAHKPQVAEIARITAASAALVAAAPPPASIGEPPVIWRVDASPAVLFDIPVGPRMVVVPAGEATIGAAGSRRRVRFAAPVAIGMFPITYGEYGWFASKTARPAAPCAAPEGTVVVNTPRNWQEPGFPQTARSPVTCVTFDDATAYVEWLSTQTGQRYRLLSEDEYEFVNRAGTTTAFWWGDDAATACQFVNGLDADAASTRPSVAANTCHDGHVFTMPLDVSKANPFGVFDTTGNLGSWTVSCWGRLAASASSSRTCREHVIRGGSWASAPAELRADARSPATGARSDIGFRIAREI